MKPPHLPQETCSIKQHRQLFRVKLLLVCVFFGLLAGGTGAIIVLGWIWPNTEVGSTWIVSQNKNNQDRVSLQSLIAEEANDKIFSVYTGITRSARAGGGSLENKLGDAVSVSSDGWLTMYLADRDELGGVKSWSVLSHDGVVYQVVDYRFDPYAELVYLKVSPQAERGDQLTQYKVIGFYTDEPAGSNIFIFDHAVWQADYLTGPRAMTAAARLDTAFNVAYVAEGDYTPGEPVINSRGWLVGFVTRDGLVLPVAAVAQILPQILSGQKIKYPSLGTSGWYGHEKPIVYAGEQMAGYYVSRVWHAKSVLRAGDIVISVDGRPVADSRSFFDLSGADKTLVVRRGEQEITLVAPMIYATETDYQQTIN